MTRRRYTLIALLGLLPCAAATYWVGGLFARGLSGWSWEWGGLLAVLGWVLGALFCVLLWAALLMPLRQRAGFPTLGEELEQMRQQGGFAAALAREQQALEAQRQSETPATRRGYHLKFAGVGMLMGVLFGAISVGLSLEAQRGVLFLWVATAVCPALALYHLIRAAMVR